MSSKIKKIKAREILDSRGNPTVEVEVNFDSNKVVASVPSGASTGEKEALELRDNNDRYSGKGVKNAVRNVNTAITEELEGMNPADQKEIDRALTELDGTEDKSNLGANALLGTSMACCRAGAETKEIPLYQHIANIFNSKGEVEIPTPCFNILNGGAHAGNDLSIQEFMIVPSGKDSFKEKLRVGAEVYYSLKKILEENFGPQSVNVGDEGGFAPNLSNTGQALGLIKKSIKIAGHENIKVGLDCAASEFYEDETYNLDGGVFTKEGILKFYKKLVEEYSIAFLEDPFAEEDWEAWKEFMSQNKELLVVGDDLLVTNPARIRRAEEEKACNAMISKPNQIGTITEALEAASLAEDYDWEIIVSHRSGDTCDSFIADLAVGIGSSFIKSGAPCRGERLSKYNRLLRIEEEIKD